MTQTHDTLVGQILADRYRILRRLGEGGMGRVYLAEHVRMGRPSAVKVLSPALALSADAIARFNREAANASRINHPNVAAIYDFGETPEGLLYLAMEYVEGHTLTALLAREGSLSMARAAELTRQAAAALTAAHHLGIVHRDLKPDNIMVAHQVDGAEWVKVLDFGIAKATGNEGRSQTVTTAGISLGTPEFMSPEQLAGEPLDPRTDIYSLALVLFNLLTGVLPYPAPTSKETLVRRLTTRPKSLEEMRPGVAWSPALQAALDRALAPDVDERYAAIGDFARDVVTACSEASGATTAIMTATTRPVADVPTRRMAPARTRVLADERRPVARRRTAPSRRRLHVVGGIALFLFVALATLALTKTPLAKRAGFGRRAADARPSLPGDTLESIMQALRRAASPGPGVMRNDGPPATRRSPNEPADALGLEISAVRRRFRGAAASLAAGQPAAARAAYRDAEAAFVDLYRRYEDPVSRQRLANVASDLRGEAYDACRAARDRAASEGRAGRFPCESLLRARRSPQGGD